MLNKRWLGRRGISMLLAIPPLVANYLSVVFLQSFFSLTHLWVLSIVAVGDLIGYMVYFFMLDWNIRMIQQLKD